MKARKPTVEIYKRADWRWRLKHGNGKILAASSEGFATKFGAKRNLRRTFYALRRLFD